MPKSKPSALNDYPVTEFYPAVLKNYPNAGWRIEYYVLNPQTQTMVRRQMKLNLLRSRYTKLSDFRRHANEMLFRLNAKLRNGWSPLMEEDNNRLYMRLDDVLRAYIDEKRRELRPDTLTVMQHADHHDLSMTTRYANHADPMLIKTICENAPNF